MSEFRKGDRVRVSYEAAWDQDRGTHYWLRDLTDGSTTSVPNTAAVELIERKDDPSKDPVGTVRQDASAPTFVAVKSGNYHDSDSRGRWMILDNGACQYSWRTDQEMIGWPVVGVMPFTPAAEKQAADELSRQQGDEERKLWTGDGSEEPPAHVTRVADRFGRPRYRHGELWSWAPAVPGSGALPWRWKGSAAGPFTEVRD